MAYYSQEDLQKSEHRFKINLINSITGIKPGNLIGTKSKEGYPNLAIFSSVVHLGSNPALIGFILRPTGEVPRHTYDNIISTGSYTINHVHKTIVDQAHYTSAKFDKEESEFEKCELTEEYVEDFWAPFVKESKIKMGLKLIDDIPIVANGTHLIVGEVLHVIIDDHLVDINGHVNLEASKSIGISGLDQYYYLSKFKNMPYARPDELPDFKGKKRPDQIVFDEETQKYNSSLLPYGSNIGAPNINSDDIISWKSTSINKFNHALNNKIEVLKKDYENIIEEYKTNDLLYRVNLNFEPVVGKVYHLYVSDKNNEPMLSMIPPQSWDKEHLGSYKLNHEKIWERVDEESD